MHHLHSHFILLLAFSQTIRNITNSLKILMIHRRHIAILKYECNSIDTTFSGGHSARQHATWKAIWTFQKASWSANNLDDFKMDHFIRAFTEIFIHDFFPLFGKWSLDHKSLVIFRAFFSSLSVTKDGFCVSFTSNPFGNYIELKKRTFCFVCVLFRCLQATFWIDFDVLAALNICENVKILSMLINSKYLLGCQRG